MGQGYILDTNTVIYYLEGLLPQQGDTFIENLVNKNESYASVITRIELLGWEPPSTTNLNSIHAFLSRSAIFALDEYVVDVSIFIRKNYRRIKLPDAIIAATCIRHERVLITRNIADFSIIKELSIINPFDI